MSRLVHLVYIHGFQGNDTTFQSFPLDLQTYLSPRAPPHLDIKIQSSLYPTYKSVKPLTYATKNFLEWLQTQPPGPVILLGHSMGGLLAAEAATDLSNAPDENTGKPSRIVGIIAFDTPYLGMHPHVIISGIASLLPKGAGDGEQKSEGEMNPHPDINIVPEQVTDEWEDFKRSGGGRPAHSLSNSETLARLTVAPSSSSASHQPSSWLFRRSPSPLFDRIMNFASAQSETPLIRWLKKHSDDPTSAGKQWVVERLQFGGAMFDPSGLKKRYTQLVNWNHGMWVNYWTTTPGGIRSEHADEDLSAEQVAYNDRGLVEAGIVGSGAAESPSSLSESRKLETSGKKHEKMKEKVKSSRHFIVLPTGLGRQFGGEQHWEKVIIGGVEDEVAAHCGLFIRGQNLDYDGLLERVSARIIRWCERL